MPQSKLGKWSVILHLFFLIIILTSIIFVNIFKILNYDDTWWDITAAIIFPTSLIAFILGVLAINIKKDSSRGVFLSVLLGLFVIIFILTHSLFIND
ncbi:hypothetical protein A2V49_01105 [candidate division WWE3 bacterium RBG_19FT_COMBO_34_6]|uniref:Uncharacterized protein n=1 Tax=candidate division WWE3 bacterium RBG_19FT_COMBO_34_6 TaxID=1802612 RepID=A0A1F4UKR2_UNCKA|nr:MAG: hypothetical protein A2V49_01105 [candidate division WWE3 bacterium RBG_19FT_COMBO_34_6]